jgi:hypothetical protein
MKKSIVTLSAIAALTTTSFASDDIKLQLELLKNQIKQLEEKMVANEEKVDKVAKTVKKNKKNISANKILANNDNIKWDIDFRTAVDKISYKTASGNKFENDALLTNRLLLNMGYAPSDNVFFKGALGYHKVFGAAPTGDNTNGTNPNGMPQRGYGYDVFDWISNETASSNSVTVKEAYWLYKDDTFLGAEIPWTASIGRRPSTDGFLANMRNNTAQKSPLGHTIDVEFDGASFKFGLDKLTDVQGMYWKLCLGRGLSNATPRFDMSGGLNPKGDYSEDENALDNIDLAGFIFVPYDDGQYQVMTTYYKAKNLPGFTMANGTVNNDFTIDGDGMVGSISPLWSATDGTFQGVQGTSMNTGVTMKTIGDLEGAAVSLKVNGIGDGISDFLDDTIFFASYARSKTKPDNQNTMMDLTAFDGFKGFTQAQIAGALGGMGIDVTTDLDGDGAAGTAGDFAAGMAIAANGAPTVKSGMLGSNDSETGNSIYIGVQVPCPLTEDGKIGLEWNKGSKYWRSFTYGEDTMAASKLAARGTAWEIYYIKPLTKSLTLQARYTKIDYDYTGSQGFFGDDGTPYTMDEAQAFGMDPIEEASDLRLSISYKY